MSEKAKRETWRGDEMVTEGKSDDAASFKASAAGMLHAFLTVDPREAEPLRREYCVVCRRTAAEGATAASRMLACTQRRCGLRDPENLRAEQDWARVMFHRVGDPTNLDDMDEAQFNSHIAEAGCATIAISRDVDGVPTFGFGASTLRGQLHVALVQRVAAKVGDMPWGFAGILPADAEKVLAVKQDTRQAWQKKRAAALRAEGVPDKQIAHQLGYDPKTIRNWLGPRERVG